MSSIGNTFQTRSNDLVGPGGFFSVDKKTNLGPIAYLRDKNNNIVGFTFEGKHAFLENVQKDSSGALFATAKYKMPQNDLDNIIAVFRNYANKIEEQGHLKTAPKFFKSRKHLFVNLKDKKDKFLDAFLMQTVKLKKVKPFVDVKESTPEVKQYTSNKYENDNSIIAPELKNSFMDTQRTESETLIPFYNNTNKPGESVASLIADARQIAYDLYPPLEVYDMPEEIRQKTFIDDYEPKYIKVDGKKKSGESIIKDIKTIEEHMKSGKAIQPGIVLPMSKFQELKGKSLISVVTTLADEIKNQPLKQKRKTDPEIIKIGQSIKSLFKAIHPSAYALDPWLEVANRSEEQMHKDHDEHVFYDYPSPRVIEVNGEEMTANTIFRDIEKIKDQFIYSVYRKKLTPAKARELEEEAVWLVKKFIPIANFMGLFHIADEVRAILKDHKYI